MMDKIISFILMNIFALIFMLFFIITYQNKACAFAPTLIFHGSHNEQIYLNGDCWNYIKRSGLDE